MYQQRIDTDSASLEGMEEVFEENSTSLPGDRCVESPEPMPPLLSTTGNRVLRGTYNQGMLLLREEVLKPLAIAPEGASRQNQHPARILYSRNQPGEPLRSFETELVQSGQNSHPAGLLETNSEILELIKQHSEQAKVANELIRRLTEQLQQQSQYIERLRSGQPSANIWERLWTWFRSR